MKIHDYAFLVFVDTKEGNVVRLTDEKDDRSLMRIVDDDGKTFRLQPKFDESLNFWCPPERDAHVQVGKARCAGSQFFVDIQGMEE